MKGIPVTVAGTLLTLALGIACPVARSAQPPSDSKDAPGFSTADKNNSFRGIPFGTPLEEVQKKWELTPVTEGVGAEDALKLFIKNDEVKKIGDLTLQEVTYYFFQGRFYAVEVETPDTRQTQTLRQALEIAYRRGPNPGASPDSLVWAGENVSTLLMINPLTGEGRMLLFNNAIQGGYESYFLESAKRTASQL